MRLYNKLKGIINMLKTNKLSNEEWFKKWEKAKPFMDKMEREYDDLDVNRLAIGLVKQGTKVLSAGCGCGREVRFLVQLGCEVVGVDCSQNMINLSKKNEPNATYFVDDMRTFNSEDDFDYIICLFNTINHLPNLLERKRFINNAFKLLKNRGKLIIVSINKFTGLSYFFKSLLSNKDFWYSPKQIEAWFSDNSFKYQMINIDGVNLIVAEKLTK